MRKWTTIRQPFRTPVSRPQEVLRNTLIMEGADGKRRDDVLAKCTQKDAVKINFIEMPEGVIQFCAPPKSTTKSKKNPRKTRARHPSHKNEDMDDISKMMQKLHFASSRHKVKSSRRQAKKHVQKVAVRPKPLFKDSSLCTFVPHRGFPRRAFTPTTKASSEYPAPTPGADRLEMHQNICLMSAYNLKSFEEVRFEDYPAGWKGSISTSNCGPEFKPTKENSEGSAMFQVITASREYADCSLEELRMEHYMPSVAWKHRQPFTLSASELKKLPVAIGSTAYVFMEGAPSKRKGIIRYIGRLPKKKPKETFAGLEFQDQWGVCDGRHEGVRFFRTKDRCAEFIPIDSVLPEYMITESKPDKNEPSTTQSDEGQGTRCSICWVDPIKIIFLPCGHFCTCMKCSKLVEDCPVCRKKIITKQRVYVSGK